MKDLEEDYKENKENCEHLVQRRNQLILAAKPLNFMETFRFAVIQHYFTFFTLAISVTYNLNHVFYLQVLQSLN